jgi:Reverse transcriptase (RNA-dependent DNA polymerase)
MSYIKYVSSIELSIPSNLKSFWSFVNSLKKTNGIPSALYFDNSQLSTPDDIANGFADFFETCYTRHIVSSPSNSIPDKNLPMTLSSHTFTHDEISQKIYSLDTNKSAGPDGIPPLFLKSCCQALVGPLCSIFQRCFDSGYFPDLWKTSTLFPIHKTGDKTNIRNYRGISKLSVIPKLFEAIIADEIFETYKHYIAAEQHGFFKTRSTVTNLSVYHQFLCSSIESGLQVDVIYTDISKAFDTVCHSLLIDELSSLGIHGCYLMWIKSYLENRRQRVLIGGAESREIEVSSGVPQGSHLGPILFSLFVNDVVKIFHNSRCLLYADDLKLFCPIQSTNDTLKLQSDLSNLSTWCKKKMLTLNISKCSIMRFYRRSSPLIHDYELDNLPLSSVTSYNDLGVIFDTKLTFNLHIDQITLRSFRMLGFIKRNTLHITDTSAIKSLYFSLVRSILEYNSAIWSPTYICHVSRLERVQNKFSKFLLWKFHFPCDNISYTIKRQLCGLQSLQSRRNNSQLFLLYKTVNGLIDCNEIVDMIYLRAPARLTRDRQLFYIQPHRTNYGLTAAIDRLVRNYNHNFSHIDLFNIGLNALKAIVSAIL